MTEAQAKSSVEAREALSTQLLIETSQRLRFLCQNQPSTILDAALMLEIFSATTMDDLTRSALSFYNDSIIAQRDSQDTRQRVAAAVDTLAQIAGSLIEWIEAKAEWTKTDEEQRALLAYRVRVQVISAGCKL